MLRFASVCAALAFSAAGLAATTETVLFSFPGSGVFPAGAEPQTGLLEDAAGNLYGTTSAGGAFNCNCGIVFMLSPPASGGTVRSETILHTFQGYPNDGAVPLASLTFDSVGNLYGTTLLGGASQAGTVFKLTPPQLGQSQWSESLLYEFSATGSDGQFPYSSLSVDTVGNLYGTTFLGGANDLGLAYRLVPPASGTGDWTLVALHDFVGGSDGANPIAGLTSDAQGNLFGTTFSDGVSGVSGGTLFELTSAGGGINESVLHSFTAADIKGQGMPFDGGLPYGNLLLDSHGNIYGTTLIGGGGQVIPGEASNAGTVFMLTPPRVGESQWHETLIHSFNGSTGSRSTTDGASPYGGLVFDTAGNLYGTTAQGGLNDEGTVFKLAPPVAGGTSWAQTVLHHFKGYPDGAGPYGALVLDNSGHLYGATRNGTSLGVNADSIGTVFDIAP